ncbi:MAG TPA: hypothetical protein VLJ76_11595 [Gaiellaceae bacterium]|nr:hypothetical protein [Gaiellaceae bacterium]
MSKQEEGKHQELDLDPETIGDLDAEGENSEDVKGGVKVTTMVVCTCIIKGN